MSCVSRFMYFFFDKPISRREQYKEKKIEVYFILWDAMFYLCLLIREFCYFYFFCIMVFFFQCHWISFWLLGIWMNSIYGTKYAHKTFAPHPKKKSIKYIQIHICTDICTNKPKTIHSCTKYKKNMFTNTHSNRYTLHIDWIKHSYENC